MEHFPDNSFKRLSEIESCVPGAIILCEMVRNGPIFQLFPPYSLGFKAIQENGDFFQGVLDLAHLEKNHRFLGLL